MGHEAASGGGVFISVIAAHDSWVDQWVTNVRRHAGTMDEEVPVSEAYEHGELLLYKARILEEGESSGCSLFAIPFGCSPVATKWPAGGRACRQQERQAPLVSI